MTRELPTLLRKLLHVMHVAMRVPDVTIAAVVNCANMLALLDVHHFEVIFISFRAVTIRLYRNSSTTTATCTCCTRCSSAQSPSSTRIKHRDNQWPCVDCVQSPLSLDTFVIDDQHLRFE